MAIEMRGVGGEHDMAAGGLDPHALQPLRVAADVMHRSTPGTISSSPSWKATRPVEQLAHHRHDVVGLERQPQRAWHMQRPVA
jgi:hypothetical protein